MKDEQIKLAKMYGYVESIGSDKVRRGSLVPYDHETSPLSVQDIEKLQEQGFSTGHIIPPS